MSVRETGRTVYLSIKEKKNFTGVGFFFCTFPKRQHRIIPSEYMRFFMSDIAYTQNNVDQGTLRVQVTGRQGNEPIPDAKISISYSGDPEGTIEEVNTNSSGMSEQITLDTPPLEYSMEPGG